MKHNNNILRRNFYIVIFLICNTNILISQTNDSIIIKKTSDFFSKKNRCIDTLNCHKLTKLGNRKVKVDSLYIPESLYDFSKTAKKLLSSDYGLYERDIISGDVTIKEVMCFDLVIETAIKKKWGQAFLDSINIVSDSLINIGLGYKESSFKNEKSLSEFVKENFEHIDSIKDNKLFRLLIEFDISLNGSIENIKISKASDGGNIFSPLSNNKQEKEINLLLNKIFFAPATLRGKAIVEKRIFIIKHGGELLYDVSK